MVPDTIVLGPEHINRLESIGTLHIYNNTEKSDQELINLLNDADILIMGMIEFRPDVFKSLKNLKMLSLWTTGYDYVDIDIAKKHNILLTNVPGYSAVAVAEHVFAMLFSLLRKIPAADGHVKMGFYDRTNFLGSELAGKTMGVIGAGSIGKRVAQIAKSLEMNVIVNTANPSKERAEKYGFNFLSFEEVLMQSDFISLHIPLKPDTENMVSYHEFNIMKNSAIVINTARGKIIDEDALVDALNSGKIAGACIDVLSEDKVKEDNSLLNFNNVILSPHCAFYTKEAIKKLSDIAIDNIVGFINGNPQNVIF